MDKVLYHAGCHDGFCAAWLCHKVWPNAEYIPVQYGQPAPDVTGSRVLIVDFSYPRDVLLEMRLHSLGGCNLTVLDHHKSAERELADLDFCTFDMNKSGARLTWQYLWDMGITCAPFEYKMREDPCLLVCYTEDRDLWRHKMPFSREVNAALRSYPFDFAVWDRLDAAHVPCLIDEGAAILREQQKLIDQHVNFARPIVISGQEVLGVNATCHASEIAQELAKKGPFGVCWFESKDGDKVYSLRSTEESGVDVSLIAKQLGGGGHPRAAGFTEKRK